MMSFDTLIFEPAPMAATTDTAALRLCTLSRAEGEEEEEAGARTRDTSGIAKAVRDAIFYSKQIKGCTVVHTRGEMVGEVLSGQLSGT
jgi:ribosomal 30S subunit maturation factor RimM